ncbi:hypothetical protein DFA_02587 [Cavenderia fasciculata]|uniref:separase n=1 Tax=Cavenderia fasciculata TaxID=261658 RepID=F4PZT4_CACFS|nr:uncharacterized protein DFA_02587 [Cavenderia fasciculata]EGG18848.1 hypothetical protein DFA_02587 [Cavenderia fasciculata]|eukprot:XP_004357310.1 hypothetical protein DFA_02587 [Cavenderia fasciculata]
MDTLDKVVRVLDDADTFKKIITAAKSCDKAYTIITNQLQTAVINKLITSEKNAKLLIEVSEHLQKGVEQLFGNTKTLVGFEEGAETAMRCNLFVLDALQSWSATRPNPHSYKRWLRCISLLGDAKRIAMAVQVADKLYAILKQNETDFPLEKDPSYYQKLMVHCMFIKMQLSEERLVTMDAQEIDHLRLEWSQLNVDIVKERCFFNESLFPKYFNRLLSLDFLGKEEDFVYLLMIYQVTNTPNVLNRFMDLLFDLTKNDILPLLSKIALPNDIVNIVWLSIHTSFYVQQSQPQQQDIQKKALELLSVMDMVVNSTIKSTLPNQKEKYQLDILLIRLSSLSNRFKILSKINSDSKKNVLEKELNQLLPMINQVLEDCNKGEYAFQFDENDKSIGQSPQVRDEIFKLPKIIVENIYLGVQSLLLQQQQRDKWLANDLIINLVRLSFVTPFIMNQWLSNIDQKYSKHLDKFILVNLGILIDYSSNDLQFSQFEEMLNETITRYYNELQQEDETQPKRDQSIITELVRLLRLICTRYRNDSDDRKAMEYFEMSYLLLKSSPVQNIESAHRLLQQAYHLLKLNTKHQEYDQAIKYVSDCFSWFNICTDGWFDGQLDQPFQSMDSSSDTKPITLQGILKSFSRLQMSILGQLIQDQEESEETEGQEDMEDVEEEEEELNIDEIINHDRLIFISQLVGNECSHSLCAAIYDYIITSYNAYIIKRDPAIPTDLIRSLQMATIDRVIEDVEDRSVILKSRYQVEKVKLMRLDQSQDSAIIDQLFHAIVDQLEGCREETDSHDDGQNMISPLTLAIDNELAKISFWKAITYIETNQNHFDPELMEHGRKQLGDMSQQIDVDDGGTDQEDSVFPKDMNGGSSDIAKHIEKERTHRYRPPVGTPKDYVGTKLRASLEIWCRISNQLTEPKVDESDITETIKLNNRAILCPLSTLSILMTIADLYQFEGDYISSIMALKIRINIIKHIYQSNSTQYIIELLKSYNYLISIYILMEKFSQSKYYFELNNKLFEQLKTGVVATKPNERVSLEISSLQLLNNIQQLEYQFHKMTSVTTTTDETNKKMYNQIIEFYIKICKLVSLVYLECANSNLALKVSNEMLDFLQSLIPSESNISLKKKKNNSSSSSMVDNSDNMSIDSEATSSTTQSDEWNGSGGNSNGQLASYQSSLSKWSCLTICLNAILHLASVYELRGCPREAHYYYERGLLIGNIYGSLKVTCEFLVELGELCFNRHNYVDSKINLEVAISLVARFAPNESRLIKINLLAKMLLGDLYRRQNIITQSTKLYNQCISMLDQMNNSSLLEQFKNSLTFGNDSTPKEKRLLKLTKSKSTVNINNKTTTTTTNSKTKIIQGEEKIGSSLESILDLIIQESNNGNNKKNDIGEIENILKSIRARIQCKLAKILMIRENYKQAVKELEAIIKDNKETVGTITLSILELHLGRAYYLMAKESERDMVWAHYLDPSTVTIDPNILKARQMFLHSFSRVGIYNIIKISNLLCRYIAFTTGTILPFVTVHFLNLSMGIRFKHDMESIVTYQQSINIQKSFKKNKQQPASVLVDIKKTMFSWNCGVEIPSQLEDKKFNKQLTELYSGDLPTEWSISNIIIGIDRKSIVLTRLFGNQPPTIIKIQMPVYQVELEQNDNNESEEEEEEQDESDEEEDEKEEEGDPEIILPFIDKLRNDIKTLTIENLANNHDMVTGTKAAMDQKTKKDSTIQKWFQKRKNLESEVDRLINSLDEILGPWKSMLVGNLCDTDALEKLEKNIPLLAKDIKGETETDASEEDDQVDSKRIDLGLLKQVFVEMPYMNDENLYQSIIDLVGFDRIDGLYPSDESYLETIKEKHPQYSQLKKIKTLFIKHFTDVFSTSTASKTKLPIAKRLEESLERVRDEPRIPSILIMDKNLQLFPVEAMEPLRSQSVYRLPSFSFHQWITHRNREETNENYTMVDPKKLSYILNPKGDLASTETNFSKLFDTNQLSKTWKGIKGRAPTSSEYRDALEQNQLFLYMGHGSGEQYCSGKDIQKLSKCAVSMLFGCRSGNLEEQGEYEPTGVILDMLLAGSQAIVGHLWDIPSMDSDRLAQSFIEKWFIELKQNVEGSETVDIGEAISHARKSCQWKLLVGSSCICYGLPTYLSPFK